MISVSHVACGYNKHAILSDVTLQVESGKAACILGSNGAGKTTLFRTLLSFIPPIQGNILVDDVPLQQLTSRQIAQKIAYVPQARSYSFQHPAIDVVVMGRAQYVRHFSAPAVEDYAAAKEAMDFLEIRALEDRPYAILSGGEQQLVLIARALAQGTKYLLLDEPSSNLDLANQSILLKAIQKLKARQVGVLMISHSPSHALFCCDNTLVVFKTGDSVFGPTNQVVTTPTMQRAYGTNEIELIHSHSSLGKTVQVCSFV